MKKEIERRTFIKKGVAVGAMTMLAGTALSGFASEIQGAPEEVDISVVKGRNYFENTLKAVEQLGGMKKYVTRDSRVGLLVNSPFKNYGTHVKPEIVLAAVKMCYQAGAKEILILREEFEGYWQRSPLSKEFADEIKSLKPGWTKYISHDIPKGISLKDASVTKDLLECDVLINISIVKDHTGTGFSCILKNMMGAAASSTNLTFHLPFGKVDKLSQCIADLNLIRNPDLCIADATEFITTKGPWGPGKIKAEKKVVAGANR
ncbi:DUF362 domain-containing protein, partial [bacterium]|nr:DUF362 domain-containing protein [bacterium]